MNESSVAIATFVGIIPLILVVTAGLGFLQVKLARKENKAPGLILPIATFIISVLYLFRALNYEAGVVVEYAGGVAFWFFIFNIPTIVWVFIFVICRKNRKAKKEIEKMNIMDLE